MLPGLRFLFATVVLSLSVLVFGLGAAALLRAAHEDFVSLPSWRLAQQPLLAPQFEMNAPSLGMLRMEAPVPKSLVETARPQPMLTDALHREALRPTTIRLEAMHSEAFPMPPVREAPQPAPLAVAARSDGDAPGQSEQFPPAAAPVAETTESLNAQAGSDLPAAETPAGDAGPETVAAETNSTEATTEPKASETSSAETKQPDPTQPESKLPELRVTAVKSWETEASEPTSPETISPEVRSSEATAIDTLPQPALKRTNRLSARAIARRRAAAIARAERARVLEQQRLQKNAFPLFSGG
ncbi:hypothetical protein BH10PSE10_BH10PSE10_18180 [soil metagenome]